MNQNAITAFAAIRKGASLLLAVLLVVAANIGPLLDQGYDSANVHVEVPDTPAGSVHPGTHNHAFCAVLASTPVLPGASPATQLMAAPERRHAHTQAFDIPRNVSFTVLHSRAPPLT